MAEQENLQVVRTGFEAWNAHDPDRFVACSQKDSSQSRITGPRLCAARKRYVR